MSQTIRITVLRCCVPSRHEAVWRLGTLSMLSLLLGCFTSVSVWGQAPNSNRAKPVVRGQQEDEIVRLREEDNGFLRYVSPSKAIESAREAAGYGPDEQSAKSFFDEGEAIFVEATKLTDESRQKQFMKAAKLFKKASSRWPNSVIEEDSLFMLGESYFFADRYPKASETYTMLVVKYQNTRHLDTVDKRRFALAQYWVEHHELDPSLRVTPNFFSKDRPLFDQFVEGILVFDKIRFDNPTGKLADDATMAAGIAYFKKGRYQAADEMFADLRRAFPNSEHQFQAHLLGVQCKLEIYQGPDYAVTPMDQAEDLLKQVYRQFPQESREQQEFLKEAWKQVRLNKASHDWRMAKYYDNRKEYAAARQYYARVQRDYADTSLAQDAAVRVAEISDKAPEPESPVPWLTNLFPTPEQQKPLVAQDPFRSLKR